MGEARARKPNKRRLLKLADFLETVPGRAFNIKRWVVIPQRLPEGKTPGECGFVGCAMGWAAHGNLFKGLTLSNGATGYPLYNGEGGFDAADELFNLESFASITLFDTPGYKTKNPTPKQVAKRIRDFVAKECA